MSALDVQDVIWPTMTAVAVAYLGGRDCTLAVAIVSLGRPTLL